MKTPTKKAYHCPWCKEGSGLILTEDLYKAIRMPDGSLKCETCQTEELQSRIVRVTPNSQRAREIITEEQQQVDKWNQHAMKQKSKCSTYTLK